MKKFPIIRVRCSTYASSRCGFFVIVTLTGFFIRIGKRYTYPYFLFPDLRCHFAIANRARCRVLTEVSFFLQQSPPPFPISLRWSPIIQTRVSEGFMKFRCFYHLLTEQFLFTLFLYKARGWSYLINSCELRPRRFHRTDGRPLESLRL